MSKLVIRNFENLFLDSGAGEKRSLQEGDGRENKKLKVSEKIINRYWEYVTKGEQCVNYDNDTELDFIMNDSTLKISRKDHPNPCLLVNKDKVKNSLYRIEYVKYNLTSDEKESCDFLPGGELLKLAKEYVRFQTKGGPHIISLIDASERVVQWAKTPVRMSVLYALFSGTGLTWYESHGFYDMYSTNNTHDEKEYLDRILAFKYLINEKNTSNVESTIYTIWRTWYEDENFSKKKTSSLIYEKMKEIEMGFLSLKEHMEDEGYEYELFPQDDVGTRVIMDEKSIFDIFTSDKNIYSYNSPTKYQLYKYKVSKYYYS